MNAATTTRAGAMLCVLALTALSFAGCTRAGEQGDAAPAQGGGPVESDAAPRTGGSLVYGLSAESNGWNPSTNQWAAPGLTVARSIFDFLVSYDEHSTPQPDALESFSSNADFTVWTLKLRPGLRFHNDKPADAHAFVRTQSTLARSPIMSTAYFLVDRLEAVDDLTVRATMKHPFAVYPDLLASQLGVFAEPEWLASNDSLKPIGTGPFELESWTVGERLVVKKNDGYWRVDQHGIRQPYMDRIEFRVLPDADERTRAIESGDVDIAMALYPASLERYKGSPNFQAILQTTGEVEEQAVLFNTAEEPFDDVDARRAIAHATDRSALAKAQGGEVAEGIFHPTSPWYSGTPYPAFDPTKARELVQRVKARRGTFEVKLLGTANPDVELASQVLIDQWRAVGIDATVENLPQQTFVIRVFIGDYSAAMWRSFGFADPRLEQAWLRSDTIAREGRYGLNFAQFSDEPTMRAFSAVNDTNDADRIRRELAAVEGRLADQVPYVILTHLTPGLVATRKTVNLVNWRLPSGAKGLPFTQGGHPLFQVWRTA